MKTRNLVAVLCLGLSASLSNAFAAIETDSFRHDLESALQIAQKDQQKCDQFFTQLIALTGPEDATLTKTTALKTLEKIKNYPGPSEGTHQALKKVLTASPEAQTQEWFVKDVSNVPQCHEVAIYKAI